MSDAVDWRPWGTEALARARELDRPIFLHVGYPTCRWCRRMARESFADPAVGELLASSFVSILVDREERPEIDEIYTAAARLLTHQSGWPATFFLTPELEPYFAGTYFSPEDRPGQDGVRPGFKTVAASMAVAWRERRADVEEQGRELTATLRRYLGETREPGEAPPPGDVAERALASLAARYDREHGGFGQASKFPMAASLWLLEELAAERPEARRMLDETLERMARGALFDPLGGGFYRHARDRAWRVPAFEKTLADNGLLLELYARRHRRLGDGLSERVVRATAGFLERELRAPGGGFKTALEPDGGFPEDGAEDDAEGRRDGWTRAEIEAVLGVEDAAFLAPLLGFDGPPPLAGDRHALRRPHPLEAEARRRRMAPSQLRAEIEPLLAALRAARAKRPAPLVDARIFPGPNGLAVAGLAAAGRALGEPRFVELARGAARHVLDALVADTLLHAAGLPALLGDYVFLVHGLLALDAAAPGEGWLEAAARLTDEQIARLAVAGGGFATAPERPDLLVRSRPVFDGALPAPNAVAVLNLLELARRGGREDDAGRARDALRAFAPVARDESEGARALCLAARRYRRLTAARGPTS